MGRVVVEEEEGWIASAVLLTLEVSVRLCWALGLAQR